MPNSSSMPYITLFSSFMTHEKELQYCEKTSPRPLHVYIDSSDKYDLNLLLGLWQFAPRIRFLALNVTHKWLQDCMAHTQGPKTRPARFLESLDMAVELDDGLDRTVMPVLKLKDFFHGTFSSLTELDIQVQGDFDGSIPAARKLRKLSLRLGHVDTHYYENHYFGVRIAKFLKSLEAMSALEELTLERVFSADEQLQQGIESVDIVVPQLLKKLSVTGDTRTCQPFLMRFSVPLTCTDIHLNLNSHGRRDPAIPSLIEAMRATFKGTIATAFGMSIGAAKLGLTVVGASDDNAHFGAYVCPHTHRRHCRRLPPGHCCEDAMFRLDIAGGPYSDATPDLLTVVPFAMNITTVNLIGNPGSRDAHGWPLLGGQEQEERLLRNLLRDRFPALERLYIANGCLAHIKEIPEELAYLKPKFVHVEEDEEGM